MKVFLGWKQQQRAGGVVRVGCHVYSETSYSPSTILADHCNAHGYMLAYSRYIQVECSPATAKHKDTSGQDRRRSRYIHAFAIPRSDHRLSCCEFLFLELKEIVAWQA